MANTDSAVMGMGHHSQLNDLMSDLYGVYWWFYIRRYGLVSVYLVPKGEILCDVKIVFSLKDILWNIKKWAALKGEIIYSGQFLGWA